MNRVVDVELADTKEVIIVIKLEGTGVTSFIWNTITLGHRCAPEQSHQVTSKEVRSAFCLNLMGYEGLAPPCTKP